MYVFTNTEDKILNKIIVRLQVGRINSIVMKKKKHERLEKETCIILPL